MSQLVELGNGVVDGMEVEVRGDVVRLHIVGRVLHRTKIKDLVGARYNDHAAGVLTRCALDAGAALGEPLDFRLVGRNRALLQILFGKANGGFFGDGGDGACLEYIILAEQLLGVAVGF